MMLTASDFDKKQIVFVFAKDGEKIQLLNGNMIVKDADGSTKLQVSCYRLFIVYIVGHLSITTAILQEAKKFGFYFALFSPSFRFNALLGAEKDGNTMLKEKQYAYTGMEIAKRIVQNKIAAQYLTLKEQRNKSEAVKDAMVILEKYYYEAANANEREKLLAYEGLASKVYFKNHFNNLLWQGRQPRLKRDWINSTLDIGYTVLFSFIDSLLSAYGFDTYKGVYHTQFYLRKSLVCDMVEPFRPLVDKAVKKAYNLKEISEQDFTVINHQYQVQWKLSPKYVSIFMKTILEHKVEIFLYVQKYYRCFMKGTEISKYPFYYQGEVGNGIDKL